MSSKARVVYDQIIEHYSNGYINRRDLSAHLELNVIDRMTPAKHNHAGYDTSFDRSMHVFFYSDGSGLLVNSNGSLAAISRERGKNEKD